MPEAWPVLAEKPLNAWWGRCSDWVMIRMKMTMTMMMAVMGMLMVMLMVM